MLSTTLTLQVYDDLYGSFIIVMYMSICLSLEIYTQSFFFPVYIARKTGKFKRTISIFAEDTPEAKEKFQSELVHIHNAFKDHVRENRGHVLDVNEVATGEAWLAVECKQYGLVDRLGTSWDVIAELAEEGRDVLKVYRNAPDVNPWRKLAEQLEASTSEMVSLVKMSPLGYFNQSSSSSSHGSPITSISDDSVAMRAKF
jgi:ClpP class serine protease